MIQPGTVLQLIRGQMLLPVRQPPPGRRLPRVQRGHRRERVPHALQLIGPVVEEDKILLFQVQFLQDARHIRYFRLPVDAWSYKVLHGKHAPKKIHIRGIVLGVDGEQHSLFSQPFQNLLPFGEMLHRPLANRAIPQRVVQVAHHHFPGREARRRYNRIHIWAARQPNAQWRGMIDVAVEQNPAQRKIARCPPQRLFLHHAHAPLKRRIGGNSLDTLPDERPRLDPVPQRRYILRQPAPEAERLHYAGGVVHVNRAGKLLREQAHRLRHVFHHAVEHAEELRPRPQCRIPAQHLVVLRHEGVGKRAEEHQVERAPAKFPNLVAQNRLHTVVAVHGFERNLRLRARPGHAGQDFAHQAVAQEQHAETLAHGPREPFDQPVKSLAQLLHRLCRNFPLHDSQPLRFGALKNSARREYPSPLRPHRGVIQSGHPA